MMQQVIITVSDIKEKLPTAPREPQILHLPISESSWSHLIEPRYDVAFTAKEVNRLAKKLEELRKAQKGESQRTER